MSALHSFASLSLWDFSCQLYAQPEIARTCLELQDNQGINVNLMLWCVWIECRGWQLDDTHLREAQRRTRGWDQHYVSPLRHLRQRMKVEFGKEHASIEAVRQHIKSAELAAERELLRRLESLTLSWSSQTGEQAVKEMAPNYVWQGHSLRHYLGDAGINRALIEGLVQCVSGVLRNI